MNKGKRYFICLSVFVLTFLALNLLGVMPVFAEEEAKQTATLLGGSFAASLVTIIGEGYFSGIDTAWTMIIIAVASIVSKIGTHTGITWLQNRWGFSFGIFDSLIVCIVMILWFGTPLVLKSFGETNAIGVAIESKLKKYNGVLLGVVVVSQMVTGARFGKGSDPVALLTGKRMLMASASESGSGMGFWGVSATVIACIVALAICLVVYYLVRYLFSLVDIMMVPVNSIVPFSSALSVIAKFLLVVFMLLIAIFLPGLFAFFFVVVLIAAILLFRTAYIACRYIESIYATPLFKKIFGGYDRQIPLRAKKVPRKLRTLLVETEPDLVIPVFVLKKIPGIPKMRKWDRWWLVSKGREQELIKPQLTKKECLRVPIRLEDGQKIFSNQFLFYHEIFTIAGDEDCITKPLKRIPRQFHLVFSKEYFYRYQEIREYTGFTDLAAYKQMLKDMQPVEEKQGFFSRFRKKESQI
ncbi:MAG: hypothetical protein K6D90_05285 [Lachnospiraceae bacterium]|nr:hypothetical protein [Lachnospiraceae bacterium]